MSDTENETTNETDNSAGTYQIVRQGFDGVQMAGEGPATQALVAKATADIQSRWIMAMKRPRNELQVRDRLKQECARFAFAEKAMYSVPRGEGRVTGLSIRFAEAAMRFMGNMACEAQTLFDSDEERVIRVCATDFETNATWTRDLTVKKTVERKFLKAGQKPIRTRINSQGQVIYIIEATDDDVATKEAAAISKSSRTAILRLIPAEIQEEMRDLIQKTQLNKAAKDPKAEIKAVVDGFSSLNIQPDQVEAYLEHPIEQSTPVEIVELRQLFMALRDGETTWSEIMKNHEEVRKARFERAAATVKAAKEAEKAKQQGAAQQGAAQPANGEKPKPQQAPAPQAEKTGGRGTQSTKDKIKAAKESTAAPVATDIPKTTPEPAPDIKPAPKTDPEPSKPAEGDALAAKIAAAKPEDWEMRNCFTCNAEIEVLKDAPGGATCKANCGGTWGAA